MKRIILAGFCAVLLSPRAFAEVSLVFAGDVMLDETPGEQVAKGVDPLASFSKYLHGSDIAVGNLECPVASGGRAIKKPFTFRAHPRVVAAVARHFSAVSVANNHSGDYGKEAFVETMDLLKKGGVPYFGGGRNLEEAHKPVILERKGLRIALLGYVEFKPRSFEAGATSPGMAWSEDEYVLRDMREARERYKADIVIPILHWGWEEETSPCPRQRELARKLIDAGADAVIGGHPHVTQGAEVYKGRLILYSLGNFVFNGFTTEDTQTGWLLRLWLEKGRTLRWDTIVARLDKNGSPQPDLETPSPCGKLGVDQVLSCKAGRQ